MFSVTDGQGREYILCVVRPLYFYDTVPTFQSEPYGDSMFPRIDLGSYSHLLCQKAVSYQLHFARSHRPVCEQTSHTSGT